MSSSSTVSKSGKTAKYACFALAFGCIVTAFGLDLFHFMREISDEVWERTSAKTAEYAELFALAVSVLGAVTWALSGRRTWRWIPYVTFIAIVIGIGLQFEIPSLERVSSRQPMYEPLWLPFAIAGLLLFALALVFLEAIATDSN